MMDYADIRKFLSELEIEVNGLRLSDADYYVYENDDLKEVFGQYFEFCFQALKRTEDRYCIKPSFAAYLNDLSVNAKAGLVEDNFVILFNMGLIANLYPFFLNYRFDFNKKAYKRFELIERYFDASPEWLMYQISTQFTFYHEQAHLIQKSEELKSMIFENYSGSNKAFSLEHHVLEIDADYWGAHFICYHITEYWQKQDRKAQTQETLIALLILGLSAIFSYFIFLSSGHYKIYLKESTHPHPSIRISYLADVFLNVASQTFQDQFDLNLNGLLVECFSVCEEMFKDRKPEFDFIDTFLKELKEQINPAQVYIREMQIEIIKRPYLLVNNLEKLLAPV
jgi:hypothetical protein